MHRTLLTSVLSAVVLVLACGLAACAPVMATRGNYVEDDRLKAIQLQVSSKDEVEQRLGTPTTVDPFDENRWFYIGEKTETTSFYDPDVISRKILLLTFNQDGFLQTVEAIDENAAKDVETVKKATPAPGREMNAFEQFVSNIGKFNQAGNMGSGDIPGRQ